MQFHAASVRAKCISSRPPTSGIPSRRIVAGRNGGDATIMASSFSLTSSHINSSSSCGTRSKVDLSSTFPSEVSSVFDKALEMHVASIDDPPSWGDNPEDYKAVADMLGGTIDLSGSTEATNQSDFNSTHNFLKTVSEEEEPLDRLMGSVDAYEVEPLDLGNNKSGNFSASETSDKSTASMPNVDTSILEGNGDHIDPIIGSDFDARTFFDDTPPDLLNLKSGSPSCIQSKFDVPLVTPRKTEMSNIVDMTLESSTLNMVSPLPMVRSNEGQEDNNGSAVQGSFAHETNAAAQSNERRQGNQSQVANRSIAALWEQRYAELEEFKRENGHCNVPQKYPRNRSLGAWIARQRLNMRRVEGGKGNQSYLSRDEVQRLKDIGLEASIGKGALGRLCSRNANEWETQFSALINYRNAKGTCNVPTKTSSLGRWVSNQRKKYRDFVAEGGRVQENDFGWDTELRSRFRRLEDIGFNFHIGRGNAQNRKSS